MSPSTDSSVIQPHYKYSSVQPLDDEGQALYKAVLDNPYDDAPRLIYSDWLEEHDNIDRAKFIRGMIDVENKVNKSESTLKPKGVNLPIEVFNIGIAELGKLLEDNHNIWKICGNDFYRRLITELFSYSMRSEAIAYWRRGFIDSLNIGLQHFIDYAKSIISNHPIRAISIEGKTPTFNRRLPRSKNNRTRGSYKQSYFYHLDNPEQNSILRQSLGNSKLPMCILEELVKYGQLIGDHTVEFRDTHQSLVMECYFIVRFNYQAEAVQALSKACVDYGRKQVGLDPLTHDDNAKYYFSIKDKEFTKAEIAYGTAAGGSKNEDVYPMYRRAAEEAYRLGFPIPERLVREMLYSSSRVSLNDNLDTSKTDDTNDKKDGE